MSSLRTSADAPWVRKNPKVGLEALRAQHFLALLVQEIKAVLVLLDGGKLLNLIGESSAKPRPHSTSLTRQCNQNARPAFRPSAGI